MILVVSEREIMELLLWPSRNLKDHSRRLLATLPSFYRQTTETSIYLHIIPIIYVVDNRRACHYSSSSFYFQGSWLP
jgi:hypothetical protein